MLTMKGGECICFVHLHKISVLILIVLLGYKYYSTEDKIEIYNPEPKFSLHLPNYTLSYHFEDDYDKLLNLNNFSFLLNPQPCANYSEGLLLIIIVSSKPSNFKSREIIRSTWGRSGDTTKVVFLLGESNDTETSHKVRNESLKFGDIVQGQFVDAYRNMTYKYVMGLKWIAHHCPNAKYILKTDDDVVVNSHALRHFLTRDLSPWGAKDLIACRAIWSSQPVRNNGSKWTVKESEYNETSYPSYCLGWVTIYSQDVVPKFLEATHNISFFWIDDVYVTGMVRKSVGIELVQLNTEILPAGKLKVVMALGVEYAEPFLFGPQDLSQDNMRELWKVIPQ